MEEDIKRIENLIKKCDDCNLKECIQCDISWSEIQSIKEFYKSYKILKEENTTSKNITSQLMSDFINKNVIPVFLVKEKIEELEKRMDYLNTELSKCYIEKEKLGTENDIDNNETYIYYIEQEKDYRYLQKEVLEELLEGYE